jgi:uncharacterized protein HemX
MGLIVVVMALVVALGVALAYAYGLRVRVFDLAAKLARIESTMEGFSVLATGTADAKLQAANTQIVELKQQLESAREKHQTYYRQQQDAVRRYHLSEQNSHAVQEVCFGEIRRLVHQANAKGVDLTVSKSLADAMAEAQVDGDPSAVLGGWASNPPAPESKQGINPNQGGA